MKIIVNNNCFTTQSFGIYTEAEKVFESQQSSSKVLLSETFGDNHHIINVSNSLTDRKIISIMFSSHKSLKALKFLFWEEFERFFLETDEAIYILSKTGKTIANIKTLSPIFGFFIFGEKILILEEIGVNIIDVNGSVCKSISTDVIEDYKLNGKSLEVKTMDGNKLEIILSENDKSIS